MIMVKKNKNQTRLQSESIVIPTECGKCGSRKRTEYGNRITLGPGVTWKDMPGVPRGTAYLQLIKRHTKCLECGQSRIDSEFTFSPEMFGIRKTAPVKTAHVPLTLNHGNTGSNRSGNHKD